MCKIVFFIEDFCIWVEYVGFILERRKVGVKKVVEIRVIKRKENEGKIMVLELGFN